jgi:hypothetical protein
VPSRPNVPVNVLVGLEFLEFCLEGLLGLAEFGLLLLEGLDLLLQFLLKPGMFGLPLGPLTL